MGDAGLLVIGVRTLSALALALSVSGCHRDGDRPQAVADGAPAAVASITPVVPGIGWELAADPSTAFPMSRRGEFEFWIVARNDGPTPADTERDALSYEVNGQESMMLAMAFGNGGRDRRWSALPPGQTLREGRGGSTDPTFGQSLFPATGDYHLRLRRGGRVVASLDIRVSR